VLTSAWATGTMRKGRRCTAGEMRARQEGELAAPFLHCKIRRESVLQATGSVQGSGLSLTL
jgi:hypothetical protein